MADDQAPGDSHGTFYADSSDPVFWSVGKFVVGLSIGCGSDFAWMGSVYCNDDHGGDGLSIEAQAAVKATSSSDCGRKKGQ